MKENNIDKIFKNKVESLNNLPKEVKWNKAIGWENYKKEFHITEKKIKGRSLYLSSAAAILIILITLSILKLVNDSDHITTIYNDSNKTKEIQLPDGNIVWLNKHSKIIYPDKIKGQYCNIEIDGEAYIEINKKTCERYIITAQNALISVQDRSIINIRAYKSEVNVDVTVKTGIVKVGERNNNEGLALLIKENHFCSVHKSAKLVYSAENQNENYLTWKTGKLVFNNMPVITVTDLLSEYYGTKIEVENENIAHCLISKSFDNESLDKVLHTIITELNLEIKNTNNKIILSGKGC